METPERAGFGFGASVTAAGLFLAPSTVAMLVTGAQAGRLEKRFGSKPPLIAGTLLTLASYVLLAVARGERWEIYPSGRVTVYGRDQLGLIFEHGTGPGRRRSRDPRDRSPSAPHRQ